MTNQTEPKLPRLPFVLGDAVLLGLAWFIYFQSKHPLGGWQVGFMLVSCLAGAVLLITPYLLEYRALVRMAEAGAVTTAAEQLKNLDLLTVQISAATAQWQVVQEQSGKTMTAAREIADRLAAEAAAFMEFLKKSNDSEKATLRLEVDKLRRAEGDWLQVLIRMLDHTYALHSAAVRSGQANLIEQLTNFQNACRDVARRIGLVPMAPAAGDAFDARLHQLTDAQEPPANAKVHETVATGYTFQGQLVRPALVTLQGEETPVPTVTPTPTPAPALIAPEPEATEPDLEPEAELEAVEKEEASSEPSRKSGDNSPSEFQEQTLL